MNIQSILATKGTHVVTIPPDSLIREAIAMFVTHNIGALVVVNAAGEPRGLLSERDIIRAAARQEGVFSQTVSNVMARDMIIGVPEDDIESVAHTMTEKRVRHIPVVEDRRLIGIVSIGDIVKAQRDQYRGELYTLQTLMLAQEV
jgi:CBS domain-containing protein